jgi:DNA-binding NtrC family response regulator
MSMGRKPSILVVDDEQTMRDWLDASLRDRYRVATAGDTREAMRLLGGDRFDLVLSDIRMPGQGGLDLLAWMRTTLPSPPLVILMTAFASIEEALATTRGGAFDYLPKPFGLEQLDHALARAWEMRRLRAENRGLRRHIRARRQRTGLLGDSPPIVRLREQIEMIGASRGTVLLQGESGTGKEVAARAIHESGPRRDGPFIRLNCAAIPETLLESELFGYERGAFTGAVQSRQGKFELAHGGTLLLDEISEMPLTMQAKLLRVLQEREFMRLGARYATRADVRIVATTNRNLHQEIKAHRFREDLFFRLNVIPLTIAPLRERKEDIPLLVHHFLEIFSAENGKPVLEISARGLAALRRLDWPGNVRQLQNVVERAVILSAGPVVDEAIMDLAEELNGVHGTATLDEELTLRDMERELILRKLRRTGGNRTQAARELGISVRTLRNKLHLYHQAGVEIPA